MPRDCVVVLWASFFQGHGDGWCWRGPAQGTGGTWWLPSCVSPMKKLCLRLGPQRGGVALALGRSWFQRLCALVVGTSGLCCVPGFSAFLLLALPHPPVRETPGPGGRPCWGFWAGRKHGCLPHCVRVHTFQHQNDDDLQGPGLASEGISGPAPCGGWCWSPSVCVHLVVSKPWQTLVYFPFFLLIFNLLLTRIQVTGYLQ